MLPDYVVLTHDRPQRVARLARRLLGDGNRMLVHHDARGGAVEPVPGVEYLKRRAAPWGRYGIVAATVDALRHQVHSGSRRHVVLLSGTDYPVRSNVVIAEHFARTNVSHWDTWPIPRPGWSYAGGVGRFDRWHWGARYPIPPARLVPAGKGPRKMPAQLQPHGGSQWFSLHPDHTAEVVAFLDAHPEVERFFRWTHLPDEIMLQSVARTIGVDIGPPVHHVDWTGGGLHPRHLDIADIPDLLTGTALFARKWMSDDALDELDRRL